VTLGAVSRLVLGRAGRDLGDEVLEFLRIVFDTEPVQHRLQPVLFREELELSASTLLGQPDSVKKGRCFVVALGRVFRPLGEIELASCVAVRLTPTGPNERGPDVIKTCPRKQGTSRAIVRFSLSSQSGGS
jgi:hypothetical protein